MKTSRFRPLVRVLAALALVGAVLTLAAGSASASTQNIYVKSTGRNTNGCRSASHACASVSHAVAVADELIAAHPGTHVHIHVRHGIYHDPTCTEITQSGISISSTGSGNVVIEPLTSCDPAPIEDWLNTAVTQDVAFTYVAPGVTGFSMTGTNTAPIILDGATAFTSATPCIQDFVGVYFADSSGSLTDVTVENVEQPPADFGCQPGADGDVYAVTCSSSEPGFATFVGNCATSGGTSTVTLANDTLTSYDKNGITCHGAGTTCAISDTTVTGVGPVTSIAQNGIEVGVGATATITGSTVSDNEYDSSGANASGILPFDDSGVSVTNTTLDDNDVDIAPYQDAGFTIAGSTIDTATDASFGNGQGVEAYQTSGTTVENDTIENDPGGGVLFEGTDNGTVSDNTVDDDGPNGILVTGSDLAGPSETNTVSSNIFESNQIGAVADGYGSPETWNQPGTFNQGIQGEVFFQSDTNVSSIPSSCPDQALSTASIGCTEVVTPDDAAIPIYPNAYQGVAEYLAAEGFICNPNVSDDGGTPVDGQGGGLYACTDGAGTIFLVGTVGTPITMGNGAATGPDTSSEPGCESSPPAGDLAVSCTGTVLTLSALGLEATTATNGEVAVGNAFGGNSAVTGNNDCSETIAGSVDGSGPNAAGQWSSTPTVYAANGAPAAASALQNTWSSNANDPNCMNTSSTSGSGEADPTTNYPGTEP